MPKGLYLRLSLAARPITRSKKYLKLNLKYEKELCLHQVVKEVLDEAGIEIPFTQEQFGMYNLKNLIQDSLAPIICRYT